MRNISIILATSLLLAACNNNAGKTDNNMDTELNSRFEAYKENFVEKLWQTYPGWASSVGYHKYDSLLAIPNEAGRNAQLAFWQAQQDSLNSYDEKKLNDNNRTDYLMIKNQAASAAWAIKEFKSYEWNPAQYNISGDFAEILNGTYDSADNRLRSIISKMENIPAFYEAAKQSIKNPTTEHTQLGIEQNLGGISVFEKDLPDAVAKSQLTADEKAMAKERATKAVAAIRDYATWLTQLKNESPRSFRIGKELYNSKFSYDIESAYTAEQVYEKALARKKELHGKMAKLAIELWPQYMNGAAMPSDTLSLIKQVIDKISLKHTSPDSFQASIEKQIPELTAFVKAKNLIYLDPSKPLVVRREPDYMAGVAGASISAPGPYDKEGNTYYNVGSLSGWEKQRAESYLREYNHYTLQILNIHEAIPGHYAQLVYSNQSPSIIKAIFGNGAMVEGWAVYTELMMLENGYGDNLPEMWLMYYKWNLRSTCNTILDYNVHVNNMSKEDAINLLVNEAFQQQAEAEGKWRRATLTQVQLCSYFTGFTEIYEFREEMKEKMGNSFDLKTFHEKFLSYGSAPVKYVKELMLNDLNNQAK